MSRYIDTDKAIEIWKDQDYIKLSSQETKARIMLDAVPSADVVEVVRCKDCKYYVPISEKIGECKDTRMNSTYMSYCSYGERKDDE